MYKFTFKINQDDLFQSSLNFIKHSKTFFFDVIFTAVAIIATIYTLINQSFFQLSDIKKILLIFCCVLFPVIQPIILYIKSNKHASKIKDLEVTLLFEEDKIIVSSLSEKSEILYSNIYNFIKYKNMIVLMYDSIHGQIMPNRIFNNNKDEFYNCISKKIKDAREKQKENIN